MKHTS